MSDYLIEAATKEEWAERALRAEAKRRDTALNCLAAEGQAMDNFQMYVDAYQAQLAAEAKLSKAVEALGDVAQSTGCCDVCPCHMRAIRKARTILAELKQGTE
jgi:hypothetical protein